MNVEAVGVGERAKCVHDAWKRGGKRDRFGRYARAIFGRDESESNIDCKHFSLEAVPCCTVVTVLSITACRAGATQYYCRAWNRWGWQKKEIMTDTSADTRCCWSKNYFCIELMSRQVNKTMHLLQYSLLALPDVPSKFEWPEWEKRRTGEMRWGN